MADSDAQPSINQAYETAGNPADKSAAERSKAHLNAQTDEDNAVAHRSPRQSTQYDEATPTSMARGVRGAGPGEETKGYSQNQMDRQELDAAQMAAPGEGDVANTVSRHPGASGNEPGLETDLDRKKAEQAPAREAVQQEQEEKVNVGGVLGQRGGPANPVGKDNYPNTGSS